MPSERKLEVPAINNLVIAGWTGRNVAALEAHIKELEAIGVKRPKSVPIFYRVAHTLLSTAKSIEVMADKSSGEVEFVLYSLEDGLWLGVGSDHTDRKAETYSVTLSKQMCDHPIAPELWLFEDVAAHWDSIILRSFATIGGERVLYQEGTLAGMLPPGDLIRAGFGKELPEGAAMFGGTFAAKGGIRPAERFDYAIVDPVLNRSIQHGYRVVTLPIRG